MEEQTLFTIGEVASVVGVSPHTIRAWERRHGLLTPRRTASRQRRYTPRDVEVLLQVQKGVSAQGLPLKVAVQEALGTLTRPADLGSAAWQAVLDVLPYLIAVLGQDGSILDANQGAARALGRSRDMLLGRSLLDFLDPEDRGPGAAAWLPPFTKSLNRRIRLRTAQGPELYTFDCWPLAQDGGQRLAVIGREIGFEPL